MELLTRVLLTYLVHSTLLLGATALLCGLLRDRWLAIQEAVLRAALAGGLVTTALQVSLALEPAAGVLRVPATALAPPSQVDGKEAFTDAVTLARMTYAAEASSGVQGAAVVSARDDQALESVVREQRTGALERRVSGATTAALRLGRYLAGGWRWLLATAWALLAVIALARLGVAALRLRRLLRGRCSIESGELAWYARRVAGALGVRRLRLWTAPRLAVPIARGVLRPEVCLPTRAVAEMGRAEQVALCAHELAHLARRDPAWILLARTIAVVAPLQPLNLWASRRLSDLAECLSDDLAVSASVRPAGLARSLVDVASWTVDERASIPVTAAGAWSARSRLGHRVERLMDRHRILERPRRVLLPLAAVAVLATAFVTPVVSSSAPADDPPPAAMPAGEAAPVPSAEAPAAPPPEAPPARAMAPLPPEAPAPAAAPAAAPAKAVSAARPAPKTAPAPAAKPRPEARAGERANLEHQLQELTERIEARARQSEAAMRELESQADAVAASHEAEFERRGEEMGKAIEELASAITDSLGGGKDERASAERRAAILDAKRKALESTVGISRELARTLAETARLVAEQARPTEEERRELERLARALAREAAGEARAGVRLARMEAQEKARLARESSAEAETAITRAKSEAALQAAAGTQDALAQARESLRRAEQALARAQERLRREEERARRQGEQGGTRDEKP